MFKLKFTLLRKKNLKIKESESTYKKEKSILDNENSNHTQKIKTLESENIKLKSRIKDLEKAEKVAIIEKYKGNDSEPERIEKKTSISIKMDQGSVFMGDKYDDNKKLIQKQPTQESNDRHNTSNLNNSIGVDKHEHHHKNNSHGKSNNSNDNDHNNEKSHLESENNEGNNLNKSKSSKRKNTNEKSVHYTNEDENKMKIEENHKLDKNEDDEP